MSTFDRYLTQNFWKFFLFISFAFLLLFDLFELLNQLDQIGQGSYTLAKALLFVLLTSGHKLLDLLPVITFLAVLLSLGQLLDRNELLALEALGYTRRRLALVLVLSLIFWTVPLWGLSETLFKGAEKKAWQIKNKALAKEGLTLYGEGFWTRKGDTFLKVERILDDGFLSGIELFRFKGQVLEEYLSALLGKATSEYWLLWKAKQRIIFASKVEEKTWPKVRIPPPLPIKRVETFALPAEYLSLPELFKYSRTLAAGGQNVYRYELLIWQRIATPLLAFVMGFLALGFNKDPLARRKLLLTRVAGGLAGGLAVYLLREALAHAGRVFSLPAPLVAFLPVGLITLFIFYQWRK